MGNAIVTTNFIGAGKLGKTLARVLTINNLALIQGICNSTLESSQVAVNIIGAGVPCQSLAELPAAEITFITVPDDLIEETCHNLVKLPQFNPQSLVVHCSGSLSSDVLQPARALGCHIASIHPLYSFANREITPQQFANTFFALEGDSQAVQVLRTLFNTLGSTIFLINKDKKSIYHAASVMACNYLITLANIAVECYQQADISHDTAMDITLQFMHTTLQNLATTRSAADALTGPIERGDIQTVAKHLEAIDNDLHRQIYQLLGEATMQLTTHSAQKKQQIKNVLAKIKVTIR